MRWVGPALLLGCAMGLYSLHGPGGLVAFLVLVAVGALWNPGRVRR